METLKAVIVKGEWSDENICDVKIQHGYYPTENGEISGFFVSENTEIIKNLELKMKTEKEYFQNLFEGTKVDVKIA